LKQVLKNKKILRRQGIIDKNEKKSLMDANTTDE
jgi:hypothetical protein